MAQSLRLALIISVLAITSATAQEESVARKWNEALLQSIREDFARPPVHARNLYHTSMAMYDAWAAYDTVARPFLLGNTVSGYTCPFEGVPVPADIEAARNEAISFAMFRILLNRFALSPNFFAAYFRYTGLMMELGYDFDITSTNYQSGSPAALGNYIAMCVTQMGLQDGSNQQFNYAIQYYQTVNTPLVMADPGNPNITDPNRWQPLVITGAIDQSGNPVPATQSFQSPEWGNVTPFAMTEEDLTVYQRDNHEYLVYNDPGPFPTIDTLNGGTLSDEYKWNFALVTAWGAHHNPNDGVMWDISPRSIGNVQTYPETVADYHNFYDFENGGDTGTGREINPKTGLPYEPQVVPRGDYTRVLAQYWADGPTSETPPGHWFTILNYVADHPDFVKKYNGKGPVLDDLEWDVKSYFTLGGAVHDAAVSAWGIKGWYDGVRPVSALRYMAARGQSSDQSLPSYHIAGVPLIPGYIELVFEGDPLAGVNNENVGKIKFYSWRGPDYIANPLTDIGGVDWILAEEWWPYQRKTFVTPPFGGYISGHSTYSRAAAEALTLLSGDEYFPGGMGERRKGAAMGSIYLDSGMDDAARRARLHAGDLFVFAPSAATRELIALARRLLEEALAPHDPRTVHRQLSAEQVATILGRLKPAFIHHPECKRLIPAIMAEHGIDLDQVYFDVPRLRSAYPSHFLSSGIAYAFHAHRDTWYSAPMCQLNWWLPLYELDPNHAMAFYPRYFGEPVENNSQIYNYYEWNTRHRANAAQHVGADTREQPKPQQALERVTITLVPPPGGIVLFSGSIYALAFGAPRVVGAVTPVGGSALLLGWAALAWQAFRGDLAPLPSVRPADSGAPRPR